MLCVCLQNDIASDSDVFEFNLLAMGRKIHTLVHAGHAPGTSTSIPSWTNVAGCSTVHCFLQMLGLNLAYIFKDNRPLSSGYHGASAAAEDAVLLMAMT